MPAAETPSAPAQIRPSARPAARLRILSLSCVYPSPNEPGLGLFVRARLQSLAAAAEIKVIAPVAALDYEKRRILPRGSATRRWDERFEVMHLRWLYPPFGGFWNAFFLFLRLAWPVLRLRKEFPFQLIDAHFAHPEGIAAALLGRLLGCPFLVTLRGNEPLHARSRFRRYWIAFALRHAARVITVSENLRAFAISLGADPARVQTIPNGVDPDLFFPRDRRASRAKWGLAPERRVILCAGELIQEKGHHLVLQALRSLADHGTAAILVIAGRTGRGGRDFEDGLRHLVSQLRLENQVRLLGWVEPEALAELMSAADVFCLASFTEGWPNVVHEALSCGTPVVATNVGGVPDLIPSDRYGFVIPVSDQASLNESLRRALAKRWDRAAISTWAHSRPWTRVAQEVFEQMRQTVAEAQGQQGQT